MARSRPHLTCVYAVRLTPGELAVLRGRARVAGLPLSTYLRHQALVHRIRSRGSRLKAGQVDELVRLGKRLNEFARAANTARRIVGQEELQDLLAEIRQFARNVRVGLGA
jgi:hypothetical protein